MRAGRRYRGGPTVDLQGSHLPGLPPDGPLTGEPQSERWAGHDWSPWAPLEAIGRGSLPAATGLYRLRVEGRLLVYVGEGVIRSRLAAHLAKRRLPDHAQGQLFAAAEFAASWVVNESWLPYQRLELETDLVAAHVLSTGLVPAAQFLGNRYEPVLHCHV